jgi:superfamily II DNA or RNA helicase/HKD family nuclease
MTEALAPGLHERLLTSRLRSHLEGLADLSADIQPVDAAEAPRVLARHVGAWIERALATLDTPEARLALCRHLLEVTAEQAPKLLDARPEPGGLDAALSLETLLSLTRRDALAGAVAPARPGLPLSDTGLLVNARGEHRIGDELAREMASADQVDLLCSFLKWSGFACLRDALFGLLDRGKRLRVLTTTYCGATERRVLDRLVERGAEVRVSYDTRRTRLHAKAWLFHRETGFHTAYVGSSNLSAPALTEGLEWNVRLSAIETGPVLEKFRRTFESYWVDREFEPYDPSRDAERFDEAVRVDARDDSARVFLASLEVTPYPYQHEILERLDVERQVHGRTRNLVVAATGTGKTVLAALDYRRALERARRPLRLLFVAHRREILLQSRATFRHVLRDAAFGALLVDGERPGPGQSVFASIQSLSRIDPGAVSPDHWDFVIVDECHHADARTYDRWMSHLEPQLLLGLTATPERADGGDILRFFGGRVAAELRLWDAIDRGLLCPFQYFGLADGVDISACWRNGRLDLDALDGVYSAHNLRARRIVEALGEHVARPQDMRALGFCVGKAHARFMAREFSDRGLRAVALTADTPLEERDRALQMLRDGALRAIFTVDLLNEGVDIPHVDTVLLLRPTESATVFLQQLGRGLRLARGKACLTVLDFIGSAHRDFRFDLRYRALVGGSRRALQEQIEQGFPVLPAGCSIQLAPDAAKVVLASLRQALSHRRGQLVAELRALGPGTTVGSFLEHTGLELGELYKSGRSFTALRREAGLPTPPVGPEEANLLKAQGRLTHLDDPRLLGVVLAGLRAPAPPPEPDKAWPVALVTLLGDEVVLDPARALARLWQHPAVREELAQLFEVLSARVSHLSSPLSHWPHVPLALHCRYSREQVMAALQVMRNGRLITHREGVLYHRETQTDLFFVTLQKSAKTYAPTTMYQDCALSPELFQWESQSVTSVASPTGQRYIHHRAKGVTPVLFVRERSKNEDNETVPFLLAGPADIVSHEGERPIRFVWRLRTPLPGDLYREARLVA